jgi:hypothetical protein
MKGIMELVSEMHKRKHLDWLEDSWKENKPFILCLLNTGGLPRALELFLEELDSRARMNKLNLDQMTTKDPELAYSMFVIAPKINQLFVVSKKFCFVFRAKKRLRSRYDAAFNKPETVYSEVLALSILGSPVLLQKQLILTKNEIYASILATGTVSVKSLNFYR